MDGLYSHTYVQQTDVKLADPDIQFLPPVTPGITIPYIIYPTGYTMARQVTKKTSVLCLLPSSPHSLDEIFSGNTFSTCEVSGRDLRVDFNTRVHRDQVFYTYTGASAVLQQLDCKTKGRTTYQVCRSA
jgi:hypothetical protein